MNYCVYFKRTGIIHSVTSTLPDDFDLSLIELTAEETEMFCSGYKSLSQFRVVPDYPGSTKGKLVNSQDLEQTWTSIDDIIYSLPKNISNADFIVVQDTVNKVCTAKLTQMPINRNIEYLVLAACLPGDPHLPLWIWNIEYSKLIDNDVKINYTGTDNIEFYTKRNFYSYSHEQI